MARDILGIPVKLNNRTFRFTPSFEEPAVKFCAVTALKVNVVIRELEGLRLKELPAGGLVKEICTGSKDEQKNDLHRFLTFLNNWPWQYADKRCL